LQSGKADTAHTHTIADITDAASTLNLYLPKAGGTLTGGLIGTTTTFNGLVSLAPSTLTGSSATSTLTINQTWNTTGTPTAFNMSINDIASNASSLLMNLQVGGSGKFTINKHGTIVNNFYSGSPQEQRTLLYFNGGGSSGNSITLDNTGLGSALAINSVGYGSTLFYLTGYGIDLGRSCVSNIRYCMGMCSICFTRLQSGNS